MNAASPFSMFGIDYCVNEIDAVREPGRMHLCALQHDYDLDLLLAAIASRIIVTTLNETRLRAASHFDFGDLGTWHLFVLAARDVLVRLPSTGKEAEDCRSWNIGLHTCRNPLVPTTGCSRRSGTHRVLTRE